MLRIESETGGDGEEERHGDGSRGEDTATDGGDEKGGGEDGGGKNWTGKWDVSKYGG